MKRYLYAIRLPLLVALANAVMYQFVWTAPGGAIAFNVIRVAVVLWGGYAIVKSKTGTVAIASFAGPVLLLVDVLIAGTFGVTTHDFSQIPGSILEGTAFQNYPRLAYLLGMLISFLMFFPIAMAIAAGGALLAKVDQRAV